MILKLNVNSGLYSDTNYTIMKKQLHDLFQNKMYMIDDTNKNSKLIDYEKEVNFEIIKDTYNYLVTKISIYANVQLIAVDNYLHGVVINMDKIDRNTMIKGLTNELNFTSKIPYNNWVNYLKDMYKQIRYKNKYDWNIINLEDYKILQGQYKVNVYGKLNENNEVLIGFEINSTLYNYFTGGYVPNLTPHIINCGIYIDGKPYIINEKNRLNCIIKLYIDLCNDNPKMKNQDILNIETDNYLIISSIQWGGILAILFKKEYSNKLFVINGENERISLDNIIPKLTIMGDKEVNKDIYIYNHISKDILISKMKKEKYDYALAFRRL